MKVIELREGNIFEYEGSIYITLIAEHTHQQQRRGLVRLKAKDIRTGKILQDTFRSDVEVNPVYVDERPLVYLYRDTDGYHFMDNSTYEQFVIQEEILEEKRGYLKENLEVTGLFYEGKVIDVKLPITVDLKVIEAEPGHKGDTVQGGKKKVKVETGLTIQTPLFVEVGDTVRVDTRTGEYITRV
ncbi:MAG: elongation factor P [Candidatus Omnitrophica bacterium]|nr:elongation factor P [Candidatus Omnitrophota bacterium]